MLFWCFLQKYLVFPWVASGYSNTNSHVCLPIDGCSHEVLLECQLFNNVIHAKHVFYESVYLQQEYFSPKITLVVQQAKSQLWHSHRGIVCQYYSSGFFICPSAVLIMAFAILYGFYLSHLVSQFANFTFNENLFFELHFTTFSLKCWL